MKIRGFTLIELLVVISIIGILISIILPNLNGAKQVGRDAKRIADLKNIQLALGMYYADNAKFPLALSTLAPTYIGSIPLDPNGSSYKLSVYSASGSINCIGANVPVYYHLGAVMEVTNSSVLAQDTDYTTGTTQCTGSDANFHGNATGCSGTSAASPDPCYDVVQN